MGLPMKKAVENMSYAIVGQITSMVLSVVLSLMVPKLLGTTEFAYWQLFVLYIGYVGMAHFGLMDGIYLRLGGKTFQELDFNMIGSQFWMLVVEQLCIAILFFGAAMGILGSHERLFVLLGTVMFMILDNLTQFLCYIFQAINQVKRSALATMVFNFAALTMIIVMLLMNVNDFRAIIICYVCGRLCSFFYIVFWGNKFILVKLCYVKDIIREGVINVRVGIKLLLANLLSTFLWGVGRYITDAKWGIEEFGKFAYAISLMNFYNALIYQIGMAFFPVLRQSDKEQQSDFFCVISDILCIVIPVGYLLYYPAKCLLHIWLPQYDASVQYLALLLPLCLLDGMVQILTNTYLKVLRQEKVLLWLNVFATGLCAALSLIGAFVFDSILFVVLSIVIAVTVRSLLAQSKVCAMLGVSGTYRMVMEVAIAGIFGISAWMVEGIGSWVIIAVTYIIYLISYKKKIFAAWGLIKEMR